MTKTYGYDFFRRLVSYSDGTATTKYEYNADNLRTAKTVNNTRTDYVWDGTNVMYEYGGMTQSYAYDMTGIIQSGTDTYLKDAHGSVVGKYSSAGVSLGAASYEAFGNALSTTLNDPFGYCGEYRDSESGLIYLRNRYYDPNTGRFITEDPAKDGMNWYSYCAGNPVNAWDPWGLKPGDEFENCDDAAKDFVGEYYRMSDYVLLELGTVIYSYKDDQGNIKYSYAEPVFGEAHNVDPNEAKDNIKVKYIRIEAEAHLHPNSEEISELDKARAQQIVINKPSYVGVRGGGVKVWEKQYDSNGWVMHDDRGNVLWDERIVADSSELRNLSISEKIALSYLYRSKWDEHMSEPCDFRDREVVWPRTRKNEAWNIEDNEFVEEWSKAVLSGRYHKE